MFLLIIQAACKSHQTGKVSLASHMTDLVVQRHSLSSYYSYWHAHFAEIFNECMALHLVWLMVDLVSRFVGTEAGTHEAAHQERVNAVAAEAGKNNRK